MGGDRNIRLLLAYDGTDFSGWAKQKARPLEAGRPLRTVQGLLEEALEKIHRAPARIPCAGRTDAGVHAAGQTANFQSPLGNIRN